MKHAIVESGDPNLFPELAIPRSTALGWIRKGVTDVVTAEELDQNASELLLRCRRLEKERDEARALQRLQGLSFKIFGLQIQYRRLPRSDDKSTLLAAIQSAAHVTGLSAALAAIGLSAARFFAWSKRQRGCDLEDHETCPKSRPNKLLPAERETIRRYARNPRWAHVSTTALAWLAKRRGDVFASVSTWCKLVRDEKLRTSLPRIYPAKPKIGIRADGPAQIWHVDLSVIRLVDQSKAFIQAVIDNFSRYILAWRVAEDFGGLSTKRLLNEAIDVAKQAGHDAVLPNVLCDSGVENLNGHVDGLVETQEIQRTVAQIDIAQSNSMVEAFFRRLKHAWLFKHALLSVPAVQRLCADYVRDHNEVLPHYALAGATPKEVFFGTWDGRTIRRDETLNARNQRADKNRQLQCGRCVSISL